MGGIGIDHATSVMLRNNLFLNTSGSIGGQDLTNQSSDYNFFAPKGSNLPEGSHSIRQAGTAGIVVNAAGGDFRLASGSPAIGKGVSLNATGFETDIRGIPRRRGSTWDVGAYEFVPGSLPN